MWLYRAKSLKMKSYGRFHIGKRLLIGITFSDNNAFQSQWISHITVCMFFYNDFNWLHKTSACGYPGMHAGGKQAFVIAGRGNQP